MAVIWRLCRRRAFRIWILSWRLRAVVRDIKYQDELLVHGGTDASSMQVAGHGAQVSGVSIPTAYIHSGVEMIDLNDVCEAVKLLILIGERL